MKQIVKILCLVCCLLFGEGNYVSAQMVKAESQAQYVEEEVQPEKKIKKRHEIECGYEKPIRVSGFVTNPPFGWMDVIPGIGAAPDRYINDGFAYLLFKKTADALGLKVQGVGYRSYHEALQALKKGKIDVLLGSYYDKRTLGVGTSILFPGYISNPIIVVFKKGQERDVKTLSDLKGLRGLMRQEELLYSLFYQMLPDDIKIEQVSGARRAYTLLLTKRADFLITSIYAAEAEMRRFKISDKVSLTRMPLMEPELFFVFSSESPCKPLKEKFTAQLKKERENMDQIKRLLFAQIDRWSERFRYAEPLVDDLAGIAPLPPVNTNQ